MSPTLPTPGGDAGTWGEELNDYVTYLEGRLSAVEALAAGFATQLAAVVGGAPGTVTLASLKTQFDAYSPPNYQTAAAASAASASTNADRAEAALAAIPQVVSLTAQWEDGTTSHVTFIHPGASVPGGLPAGEVVARF